MTAASSAETEPAVKSRPIIFSGEMVKAILAGKKGMTRRVVKPQPTGAHCAVLTSKGEALFFRGTTPESPSCDGPIPKCPYGKPGDLLWLRETWAIADIYDKDSGNEGQMPFELNGSTRGISIWYKAGGPGGEKAYKASKRGRWRSPIFMPRAASRITLEVTEVRVERLNSISEADCIAEGTATHVTFLPTDGAIEQIMEEPSSIIRGNYHHLWDKINYKRGYGWHTSPWVWVISFKVVQP